MSQGLTLYASRDSVSALKDVGAAISKSGIVRGCDSPELGMMFAMTAANRNTDILSLAQKFEFVNGRLSMPAKVMLAEFRSRGGRHELIERSPDAAAIKLISDGREHVFRLTWDEAKKETFVYNGKESENIRLIEAGNQKVLESRLKPKYATPRARMQMLWARVVSDAVGAICPEVNVGTYTPEEIEDFDDCSARSPVVTGAGEEVKTVTPASAANNETSSQIIDADYEIIPREDLATGEQVQRITDLFVALGIDAEGQLKAAKSVGALTIASIRKEGADIIIAKMEAKLASLSRVPAEESAAAAAAMAPTPPATPESARMSDDGESSTADQIAVIKSLIESVSQKPGLSGLPGRIKEHLNRHGIEKFKDLSYLSAQSLIDSLNGTTGLDDFFDVPPMRHVPF